MGENIFVTFSNMFSFNYLLRKQHKDLLIIIIVCLVCSVDFETVFTSCDVF